MSNLPVLQFGLCGAAAAKNKKTSYVLTMVFFFPPVGAIKYIYLFTYLFFLRPAGAGNGELRGVGVQHPGTAARKRKKTPKKINEEQARKARSQSTTHKYTDGWCWSREEIGGGRARGCAHVSGRNTHVLTKYIYTCILMYTYILT